MTNDDYESMVVNMLEICEQVTTRAALFCLRVATSLELRAQEFRRLRLNISKDQSPSLQQWVNRFIEYVDGPLLMVAYTKFAWLVENGLEPEHAFHLVIGRDA